MKALPTLEPKCPRVPRSQISSAAGRENATENVLLVLLIALVPMLGGALYHAHAVSWQRKHLERDLASARSMARDAVNELVKVKANLEALETQVETLLDATTQADRQAQALRGTVMDWQNRHDDLESAASRKIAELAAQSDAVARRLEEEKAVREAERMRLEDSLSAVSSQLAATDGELRDTRGFAREAVRRSEHLERGVWALRNTNESLSSSLASAQSDASDAWSEASSARNLAGSALNEASRAESGADRARHALDRAEGVIGSLKKVVAHERREERREHAELVRPPVVPARPQVTASVPPAPPPRPAPGTLPERREPSGGRRQR